MGVGLQEGPDAVLVPPAAVVELGAHLVVLIQTSQVHLRKVVKISKGGVIDHSYQRLPAMIHIEDDELLSSWCGRPGARQFERS